MGKLTEVKTAPQRASNFVNLDDDNNNKSADNDPKPDALPLNGATLSSLLSMCRDHPEGESSEPPKTLLVPTLFP